MCWITTPSQPRVTAPLALSWGRICLAMLIGTANPMVLARGLMAVLMPMTSPLRLISGPPELPGLMAASVWM